MTKAEEVYNKVQALTAKGKTKAEAFKLLAAEYGQPMNSIRGSYYQFTSGKNGSTGKPRRRETTPENALADARAALERSIANIDREIETAKERADEAKGEYEALKASADERRQAITESLEKLG